MSIESVNPEHGRNALRDALRVVGVEQRLDPGKLRTFVDSLSDEQVQDLMVNTLFRMHPYQQGLVDKLYDLTGNWLPKDASEVAMTRGPGTERFLAQGLMQAHGYGVLEGLDFETLK